LTSTPIQFASIQPLTTAENIASHWQTVLNPFWQNMQSGLLETADNLQLQYYYHLVANARHAIVISSGRVEMASKYTELCFDLVQAGYSVFLLDHRGQGLSQRELRNRHKGYVADFTLYQQDLTQFVQHVVLPCNHQSHIALGHSMGCAILAGCLQQPHPFQAAIFASPMFGIYTGLMPAGIAESIALAFGALNRRLSDEPWYFPGQRNYAEKAFQHNPLTSSRPRYNLLHQLYREQPDAQLGGVTTHWVQAAIQAMRKILADAPRWHTPVLLLQAGADKVVSNHAQNLWFQQIQDNICHQKVILPDARHEILMEQDPIRRHAYDAINSFLHALAQTAH
jgi:lysophospholipase